MTLRTLRCWKSFIAITLVISCGAISVAEAIGDKILTPSVNAALQRMSDGLATTKDHALLFANNDAVNAARLNGEITDHAYQAAQIDFADLNHRFGKEAAHFADAEFTVQQRTSQTFSPGTDSDYITIVKDKDQIGRMQAEYNDLVDAYLMENGAIDSPRSNWQQKLDTDFMADPRYVTDAEFREIAKMNNDAYTRRMSAEYERISRQKGGGKIGPRHVTDYTEEMSDFVRKKKGKISEMFKNPSLFNDPANRAKVIQMMAQEQKYISRIESLDDYLRAQEGLPPRNRGISVAAKGAGRPPHNVKAIKDAHKVAEASRARAIEDLTETMGEVAKNNPHFSGTAADDIAKIIAQAPPGHRAKAIAALRRSNPGLAKTILTRNPGLASADDLVRAGDKVGDLARAGDKLGDTARAGDKLSDIAKVGKMRKGLSAAAKTMERLGKVGAAADVAIAAGQMKDYLDTLNKALDPNIMDEEAADLFDKAAAMAVELSKSSLLVAIMERHPVVAAIYGTWTVGCMAGEWVAGNAETGMVVGRSKGTCLDRQMSAWDNMFGTYGTEAEKQAQRKALCDKFKTSVEEGRIKVKWPYSEDDVCASLHRGEKIADMLVSPESIHEAQQRCPYLEGQVAAFTALIDKGDLDGIRGMLERIRSQLAHLDLGPQACSGLDIRIAVQLTRITGKTAARIANIEDALLNCWFAESWSLIQSLPEGKRQLLVERWKKAQDRASGIRDLVGEAKVLEEQDELARALELLRQAKTLRPCMSDVEAIDKAISRIESRVTEGGQAVTEARQALQVCDYTRVGTILNQLNPGAEKEQLTQALAEARAEEERLSALVEEIRVQYRECDYVQAQTSLVTAIQMAKCPRHLESINRKIAMVKAARELETQLRSSVDEANANYQDCRLNDALVTLNGILPQAKCADHIQSINDKIKLVQKKREYEEATIDLFNEANTLYKNGKYNDALAMLRKARGRTTCQRFKDSLGKKIGIVETAMGRTPGLDTTEADRADRDDDVPPMTCQLYHDNLEYVVAAIDRLTERYIELSQTDDPTTALRSAACAVVDKSSEFDTISQAAREEGCTVTIQDPTAMYPAYRLQCSKQDMTGSGESEDQSQEDESEYMGSWSGTAQIAANSQGIEPTMINFKFSVDQENRARGRLIPKDGEVVNLTGGVNDTTLTMASKDRNSSIHINGTLNKNLAQGNLALRMVDVKCLTDELFKNTNKSCPQTTYRGAWSATRISNY